MNSLKKLAQVWIPALRKFIRSAVQYRTMLHGLAAGRVVLDTTGTKDDNT